MCIRDRNYTYPGKELLEKGKKRLSTLVQIQAPLEFFKTVFDEQDEMCIRDRMERKPYSAGAVKFSFWFMEFRKTVQLLSEGKSFADIKKLNEETNIYGAPTKLRAQQIYSTVTARIKTLDESFYPIFLSSDLATQK